MLDVFTDVIVPVLAMAALGGFVARRYGVPVRPLSGLTFNLFTPALVFGSLASVELELTSVAVASVELELASVLSLSPPPQASKSEQSDAVAYRRRRVS